MLLAQWLVGVAGVYLALGLAFAVPFALRGCQRLDPAADTGTWGFRVLIVPGAAALWPLLLRRWLAGDRRPPSERNAHRDAAQVRSVYATDSAGARRDAGASS